VPPGVVVVGTVGIGAVEVGVGGGGSVCAVGMIGFDAGDTGPLPPALEATTVKV
jgi:hypothetical protein